MAQNKNLFKGAKAIAAHAGELLNDKAEEAKELAAQTGEVLSNKAEEAKEKAVQTGEILGNRVAEAKKKATQASDYLSDKATEAKRDYELRRFRPITEEQLPSATRLMPELIRIVDWDKRVEEDVCSDAVAFNDGTKEMRAISILTRHANLMDASFYPNSKEGVYFRDPSNPSLYINLEDYFDYIKKAKVHELNQIAQDLGAKHVKITLKSEKKETVENKSKMGASASKKHKSEASHSAKSTQFTSIEVASDKVYKGHEPHQPNLYYFRNEPDIQNIIRRRLDTNNPIYSDIEVFKYSNSSGIKRNDVAKIDGILKKIKVGVNVNISGEVESEEMILFEYRIDYPEE